ncbi:large subunit ribosomal protein LP2 [Pancytospora philotis]|nr:large subunit ribosomal protein LP2 [Pancytospora philotis]
MERVAAYLLCVENKLEPSRANMYKLLQAVSSNVDEAELDAFVAQIGEKSYEEILSTGSAMMTLQKASSSAAAPAASAATAEAAAEEPSEESDAEMDFF